MIKLCATLCLLTTALFAQQYPERPVKIAVPFAAGGIADITVRLVAADMSKTLGQSFIVENIPGAGGVAAARASLAGGDDGHSLLLLTNGAAVSSALFKQLGFNPLQDFIPISMLGTFDFFFAVNSKTPVQNLADILKLSLLEQSKLNIATIAVGSTQNLTARLFLNISKTGMAIVPYRGTPDAITGLMRQDYHILVEGFSTLKGQVSDGSFTIIASTGKNRSQFTPKVPTVSEVLNHPFDVTSWNALAAPRGLSVEKQVKLNEAVRIALKNPDIRTKLLDLGIEPMASTPQELSARLSQDITKWNDIVSKLGLEKQ